MSAPLLNASMFTPPGPAAGIGAGVAGVAGQGQGGALAGFEALIAALFGQPAQAGEASPVTAQPFQALVQASSPGAASAVVTDPTAAKTGKADKDGKDSDAKTAADAIADATGDATPDATLALLAGGAPLTPQPVVAAAPATVDQATAVGDEAAGKAPAQPATPVFDPAAAACAKAALAEVATPATAPAAPDAPGPDAALAKLVPAATPQTPATAVKTQVKAGANPALKPDAALPQAATSEAAAPAPATPTPPQAAKQDAPAPQPAPTNDTPAAPQIVQAATLAQPAPAAAPGRSEPAPSNHRAQRDKAAGKLETAAAPGKSAQAPGHAKRAEGAKTEAPAPVEAASAAEPDGDDDKGQAKPAAEADNRPASGSDQTPGNPAAQSPQVAHAMQAPVRGAPQTVANLAAQIVKKLDAQTTRFDVQLDPAGLGKVDVRVEIGAEGRITAALACHNPEAAKELQARSGELTQALKQAGFDISGGLSFEMAGGGGGQAGAGQNPFSSQNDSGQAFRGRAFASALETAGDAAQAAADGALRLRLDRPSGVDIRI